MIIEYAERVWRGESDDSVVDAGLQGKGVQPIVEGFGNVTAFETEGELVLFDTGSAFSAAKLHEDVRSTSGSSRPPDSAGPPTTAIPK
ncbi:hypothetical protein AB0J35_29380 [Nonomuraea angiospora]|uniref:hypothetical protein n=1 Tax=Nonomuraea angiospora TaxID=46172 RepID=UPI00343C4852